MRMSIDKEPEHEAKEKNGNDFLDVLREIFREKFEGIIQREKKEEEEENKRYKDETSQREEAAARKKQFAIQKRKRQKRYRR